MYVSYSPNLYSDICQLYLNKPRRNKKQNKAWYIKHKKYKRFASPCETSR